MGEHDDELEVSPSAGAVHNDAARVAAAIAEGLQRIATVLERGLDETGARSRIDRRRREQARKIPPGIDRVSLRLVP